MKDLQCVIKFHAGNLSAAIGMLVLDLMPICRYSYSDSTKNNRIAFDRIYVGQASVLSLLLNFKWFYLCLLLLACLLLAVDGD